MSHYQQTIREHMAAMGRIGAADPRHVEAHMRSEHPTLDALSPAQFRAEVAVGIECALADPALSERLAEIEGL